ncbi:MAG: histone deacetylase family protein, partial [Nitriliruptoraceae bacterium]
MTDPLASPAAAQQRLAPIIVTDPAHRGHDPAFDLDAGRTRQPRHERPARIDAIAATLGERGHLLHPAVRAEEAAITRVHDPAMVRFLREGYQAWREAGGGTVMLPDTHPSPRWAGGGRRSTSPLAEPGWWCFDTATPIVAGSYAAAQAAVDVAVTAADRLGDDARLAYALTRPPGHHAGPDYFGGFCLLNPTAVAARRLSDRGRVAIVDIDVHHGNGTQDVFWRDPQVLYVSLHTHPDHQFPYFSGFDDEEGAGPGRGTTRNLPLPPGTDDVDYLSVLRTAMELVAAFDPATVVVSGGLDTAAADPIGQLALTADGLAEVGRT